jgi:hypothetical protein
MLMTRNIPRNNTIRNLLASFMLLRLI